MDIRSTKKYFIIVFAILLSVTAFITPISANDDSDSVTITELPVKVIYANLDEQSDVKVKAQDTFNKYGNKIVIEVRDYSELIGITENTRSTGKWVTNTRQYFIGHITYATTGKIKAFVSGDSVSKCTGEVTIYGGGIQFVSKKIYNPTKKTAYLYWTVKVGNSISGTTILGYRTPLYN